MNKIVLSQRSIEKVRKNDKIYATDLEKSFKSFKNILKKMPSYTKLIVDSIKSDEIYQAIIPKEIISGLNNGTLEKMTSTKTGLLTGMIRKVDNPKKIVKQTQWKKIETNPSELFSNLNQISIQASIAEISEMLFNLDKKLDNLAMGQHSDRVAEVEAGIDLYNQIYHIQDPLNRQTKMANALGYLSSGRRKLINNLKNILSTNIKDKNIFDKIWLYLLRIDRTSIDYFDYIMDNYNIIKENIKYINLSSVYIFRIHSMENNFKSAIEAENQYLDFIKTLTEGIENTYKYFPYESKKSIWLPEYQKPFLDISKKINNSVNGNFDLMIELTHQEIKNGLL